MYTGAPQALITTGTVKGGTLEYAFSRNEEDFSTELPTGTDAGEYTVYYRVAGDGNHKDVDPVRLTATIGKAALSTVTLDNSQLTYNLQEQTTQVTGVKAGETDVPADDYTVSGNSGTTVGEYTVTVTANENSKNFTGSATATFTIAAADASKSFVLIFTEDEDIVYDGTEKKPAVIVKDGENELVEDTDYTVSYEDNTEAGTGKVIVIGAGNYSGKQEAEFTIAKAEYDVTAPEAIAGLAYTGEEQALVTAGSVNAGTMVYSLDGENFSAEVPTAVNAGKYTVYYKVEESDNYLAYPVETVETEIAQAESSIEVEDGDISVEFGTKTFKLDVKTFGDGIVSFTSSNEKVATVSETGEVTIVGTGETTITITMAGTDNTAATTVTVKLAVTPATDVNVEEQITGESLIPDFVVTINGETLVEGRDYVISYKDADGNTVTAAEAQAKPGTYVAVVTMQGNYVGTREYEFTVIATSIATPKAKGRGTVFYDLQGRKVKNPTKKGMYIINGKKMMMK